MNVRIMVGMVVALLCGSTFAFSFFGGSSTNKPPKLHVLMEGANDFIEEAQMCELSGDAEKAIEYYNKALEELNRIAAENPDRASTAEFAPLRNKAAVCTIQIDAIKLEQVNANERRVAVTDTTKLQQKYNEKHGITNAVTVMEFMPETTNSSPAKVEEPVKPDTSTEANPAPAPETKSKPAPAPAVTPEQTAQQDKFVELLEDAKDAISMCKLEDAAKVLREALKLDPENWDARYLMAYVNVARKDYEAADLMFEDILGDRPNNVPALLLKAGSLMSRGSYLEAQQTLAAAIRANPDYYAGYYNMAMLLLEMGANKDTARKYYELGRAHGGPQDPEFEKQLGATAK